MKLDKVFQIITLTILLSLSLSAVIASDQFGREPWWIAGFESEDEVQWLFEKIKSAADEMNAEYLFNVLPPFPFSVSCHTDNEKGINSDSILINNGSDFKLYWKKEMKLGIYESSKVTIKSIREIILNSSPDTLFYNSQGVSVAYGFLWATRLNYSDGYKPIIYKINSYVSCTTLLEE